MYKTQRKCFSAAVLFFFFLLQATPFLPLPVRTLPLAKKLVNYSLFNPQHLDAAGLSSASATLSNPRLSYDAGVSTTINAGLTIVTIAASGNADNDTNHLFPNDYVGIGNNPNLQVASIANGTTFVLKTALTNQILNTHKVYSTQSGTLAVNFYTASAIPVGGSLEIDIPSAVGTVSTNDGTPDTAAVGSNGFDLNYIGASDVTCPMGFTAAAPTVGTGAAPHKIFCNLNGASAMPAGANLTVTIGTATKGLVNPAPNLTHTQGVADTYLLEAYTKSGAAGAGTTLDSIPIKIAPVEGVLVSASIDETLNFTVAAVTSANLPTTCLFTPAGTLVTTTATTVPFGSSITANTFYNGAQQLTVSTNAPGGYSVKVEQNDQMGKDGKVCTGAAGESISCIKDTTCNAGACTYSTSADWSTNTLNGLGYSMNDVSGTDSSFLYNESSRTFSAKSFPDQEQSQAKENIMSSTGVRSGSSACIVYRLSVSGTQPAGYYFNKIKYTASALF